MPHQILLRVHPCAYVCIRVCVYPCVYVCTTFLYAFPTIPSGLYEILLSEK